jgi:hypothetical protein
MEANRTSRLRNCALGIKQRQPVNDEPDEREDDGEAGADDFGAGPLVPRSLSPKRGRGESVSHVENGQGRGWKGL